MNARMILGITILVIVIAVAAVISLNLNNTGLVSLAREETITLGAILPLTGDLAAYGQQSREAMLLAVDEINEDRGISGKQLEIIFEDGQCNASQTTTAAQRLINIESVPVILGLICSNGTLAIAPMAEESETILFASGASSPDITNAGDYVFRNYPSDSAQGKFDASYIFNTLEKRRVAVLYCLSDYCITLKNVFNPEFERLGGEVLAIESFEQSSTDLRTQLTKINELGVEAIYFVSYDQSATAGIKQAEELGVTAQLFGVGTWDDPAMWKRVGKAGNGVMYSLAFSPISDEFKQKMFNRTGINEIIIGTPQSYDAVNIIAGIMQRVGTDTEKIKEELYKVEDYQGVSGTISIDENGDPANASYIVKIVEDEQPRALE
ncbi:MAG: ABC transporter substrate-binding protein [archaeon]